MGNSKWVASTKTFSYEMKVLRVGSAVESIKRHRIIHYNLSFLANAFRREVNVDYY